MNLYYLPIGPAAPAIVNVVVEIPKNTRNKIEYDPRIEAFRLDRVLYSPVRYPGDYGFIPSTLAEDGDALDVLVLVTEPTFTGCVITARVVGLLGLVDEASRDQKVLTVPERDPRFDEIVDLATVPQHNLKEIEYFFNIYKELEGKRAAALGWGTPEDAHHAIEAAARAHGDAFVDATTARRAGAAART
ncbi:MAG: inorganic diphosphatase [Anaerolineae bacterium]